MTTAQANTVLLDLYFAMLRIRRIEEKIAALYPEQQMRCPVHLCIGQEAIAAGVCARLSANDLVMSTHRAHGHYLAKGGDLKAMMAEMYGKEAGCSKGRGGSMHLIDLSVNFLGSTPIVGGTIPVATGVAFAEAKNKTQNLTVAFFGEAAIEEGTAHECFNFASLKKIPIIYVCENNLYSVNTRLEDRQPPRDVVNLAAAHDIKTFKDDGNDVSRVYDCMGQAVRHARSGGGPVFMEFATYRWLEHCGPYDDVKNGTRPKNEFDQWQKRCPLKRLKEHLLDQHIATVEKFEQMEAAIEQEMMDAVNFAKTAPFPKHPVTEKDVYAL